MIPYLVSNGADPKAVNREGNDDHPRTQLVQPVSVGPYADGDDRRGHHV